MTQANLFETWRKGFGPIVHSDETVARVHALASTAASGEEAVYRILIAADRLASAAEEALKAAGRLVDVGLRPLVTMLIEPGRFRVPRDPIEHAFAADDAALAEFFPSNMPRVIASHTRPEPMLGLLRRLDGGPSKTVAHGYISRGGTLDVAGMLFANRSTWAHLVESAARLMNRPRDQFLSAAHCAAIDGRGNPHDLINPSANRRTA